jgi:phosphate-selective porin O/P
LKFRRRAPVVGALVAALCTFAGHARAQDSIPRVALPFQLHGFVQVYYRDGDPTVKDGFRLRKADLKFSGDLSPKLRWRITFDASKGLTLNKTAEVGDSLALSDVSVDQRSRIVQDAALTYTVDKALALDIGQQIIPLSLEGTIPTAQVETIERTMFIVERSRATGLGDIRDIGVSANGRTLGSVLEYHLGVFNETGEGAGTVDANDQKAVMGRVAIHPSAFPNFQFGGSGGFEGGPTKQRRERAGGEIQYRDNHLTIRTEAIGARDGTLRRFGWYGLSAVRPTTHLQLVARFDSWDRDLSNEVSLFDATERQMTVGASYLLDSSTKFAVNVIRQTFPNVATPRAGNIVMAAFQAVW